MLHYSDARRYQFDTNLASKISNDIYGKYGNEINERTKVLFYGTVNVTFDESYIKGDVIGNSIFSWVSAGEKDSFEITSRAIAISFLKSQGYTFKSGVKNDDEKKLDLNRYRRKVDEMCAYPKNNYVSKFDDVIIVKLSEQEK